jgi:predicted TIM-barrel fold metal-dependent hydrolase
MSIRIDVHCHVLHADSVEIDSFAEAYLGSSGIGGPFQPALLDLLKALIRIATAREAVGPEDALRLSTSAVAARGASKLDFKAVYRFVKEFTAKPEEIPRRLMEVYEADDIDLFVPLMTDYENWLDGDPWWYAWKPSRWHDESRVDFMKKVVIEHRGRLHPFAPFCPIRAAVDGIEEEVGRVVSAVENDGFLGVKLYPVMGYYPIGNAALPNPAPIDRTTWVQIDRALIELYGECKDREIPITTHTSPGGARGPHGPELTDPGDRKARKRFFGPANHSHPSHWRPVLAKHPELRLNLAHVGGNHFQDRKKYEVRTKYDWAWEASRLFADFEHVYGDRSNQRPPARKEDKKSYTRYVKRFRQAMAYADEMSGRLMYGSDWHLLVFFTEKEDRVLRRLRRIIRKESFPDGFEEGFLGDNAARFLGLTPGSKAMARLEHFYDTKLAGHRPAWWEKV